MRTCPPVSIATRPTRPMNRNNILLLLLLMAGPTGLHAGEFALVNEVVTITEGSSGCHFWDKIAKGPPNWVTPDSYDSGQIHCRFEVLDQPSAEPCYISFHIWGHPDPERPGTGHPETASPLSDALRGVGSVVVFDSSPASWRTHPEQGGVNFAARKSFWRWGIQVWASKDPRGLLAPEADSNEPQSKTFWDQRAKWLPLKLRVSIVAVSRGAVFSGWDNHVPGGRRPAPGGVRPEPPVAIAGGAARPAHVKFTHFTIADPLPGKAWGTAGTPLFDLDGDGDLDTALSRRDAHGFYWYQRQSDAVWVQRLISDAAAIPQALGATGLDVDSDGWTDLVFSHAWFRNPGTLRQDPAASWTTHPFPGHGHDLLATDVNGDKRQDVVVFDGKTLCWYNPALSMASNVVAQGLDHHGGATPQGAGDIDGDGDTDLVIAGWWYANPGRGVGAWVRHEWPHRPIPNASYGTSIRSWVVDLDRDGDQDIVYSDCDSGFGHVYFVRNEGQGAKWTLFQLPDPPTSPGNVPGTGSWHSLGIADFDRDGHIDVFAGEQEDPDTYMVSKGKLPMKPKGLKERGVIWVNAGSPSPSFAPVIIQEDNPGWHDASLGDVDGDGDVDIVSKIWNKDGPTYHADYWRNDTVSPRTN